MKPDLKYIHSPEVDDLKTYSPNEYNNFCLLVQAMIGLPNDESGESFDFLICTPKWIETLLEREKFIFGKGYIVIQEYHYNIIFEIIQDLCDRISGDNWITIATKLGRYGLWEFEDFDPINKK